ncbi:unnamed protein product [Caenorhabditis bovis]|uniref:Uncharacterized protein n=1 Tax=Caenorhabditis bovis TaxID=2654633 RepID=A0A8S1EWL1_9PELO|nr:unnamed protein product [Caenorhabditis bovis]
MTTTSATATAEASPGCCGRWTPTIRLSSIIISMLLLICEIVLATFEYVSFRFDDNPISALFAGLFTFHSFFTLFYIIGAFRMIECFMVPWLTLQLIFLTTFALFTIVWWIATLLSVFGLVEYYAATKNDKGLTNTEFFVGIGLALTVTLLVSIKFSQILYKGFVSVRNQNIAHYRITQALERKTSMQLKPSYV